MRLHLDIPNDTRKGGSDGAARRPVSPQSSTASSSAQRSPSPPSPLTPGLSDYVARNPMEVSYRTEREKMPPLTPLTPAAFMNQLHSSGMAMAPPGRDPRLSFSNSWTLEFIWIGMSLAAFGGESRSIAMGNLFFFFFFFFFMGEWCFKKKKKNGGV